MFVLVKPPTNPNVNSATVPRTHLVVINFGIPTFSI